MTYDKSTINTHKVQLKTRVGARKDSDKQAREAKRIAEELYTILDTIPVMVFWIDLEGRFVRVNKAFSAALHKSTDDIIGRSLIDLYPADAAKQYFRDNREVITSGTPKINIEEPVDISTGTLWLSTTKIPLRNEKGQVIGIIGFSEDITVRKLSEKRVKQNWALLQDIFDGIPEPMMVIDSNMILKLANKSALEYHQYISVRDTILDKPCFEVLRGRLSPCEGCGVQTRLAKGENVSFERKGLMNSSQLEQVNIYFFRKNEKSGNYGAIIRISDITEMDKMKWRLIQREKLSSLGLLAAGIAHEINNPSNFISFNIPILKGYVEALLPIIEDYAHDHPDVELFGMSYDEFREDLFRLLESIKHGSDRINTTVSNLGKFARKKEKFELRAVYPKQVISRAISMCGPIIKRRVRSFRVSDLSDLPMVFSDPEIFEQVLVNLLVNAAHAADKEDSWVHVDVFRGGEKGKKLVIQISDNGCGMDKEVKGKIFEPFFTTKPAGKGIGLGLSISSSLINDLGGDIEVESELGKGSTFRIILPLLPTI